MTAAELEDLAFRGAALPTGLDCGETLCFLMFRALYDFAKSTQMPQEQGRREKQRINELCRGYLYDAEYVRYLAETARKFDTAAAAYRSAAPEEKSAAADRLAELAGCMVIDRDRYGQKADFVI